MRTRINALLAGSPLPSSRRARRLALLGAGGLLAAWVGWGRYVDRATERVPYDVVESFDGVELRRYPRAVLVETTADDNGTAFWRLFRYISGENAADETVSMTAPVTTSATGTDISMTAPVRTVREAVSSGDAGEPAESGEKVPMTAPVRTRPEPADGGVTMAFYLPAEYDPGTAPTPTDPRVRLVVEPPRTLAVREFSWYATDGRVEENLRTLRDALAEHGVEARGRPLLLQYDDPWTPPFMRRNEVAVEVDREGDS